MRKTEILTRPISFQDIECLSREYDHLVLLNSNSETNLSYLAVGKRAELKTTPNRAFLDLEQFIDTHQDWAFGYLGYDLKNEIEPSLISNNQDKLEFQEIHFFIPEIVVEFSFDFAKVHFHKTEEKEKFLSFLGKNVPKKEKKNKKVVFKQKMTKDEYLTKFSIIKEHLQLGNIYEMNFCHEFFAEKVRIDPFETYLRLNELTHAPFSSFYKKKEQFVLCGSPERYLKKQENNVLSQPIKGTAKRGKTKEEDERIKFDLEHNQKERSENIMIVDLVRNDLSRTAEKASVQVEELCKVYSFETVHQMISTVNSKLRKDIHPVKILETTFPMGSMTGAPKVAAMQIIEELETTKRGVYSGAIGYFTPEKDFDFNVVIRTLLYNQAKQYLSFMVGGAITIKAQAEQEYEETLLKAEAMINSLK